MARKARTVSTRPRLVGAGFVALDMLFGLGERPVRYSAGGTTGNVLAAIAFLGWQSTALASLERDNAGISVEQDLCSFGVNTNLLHSEPVQATPIVVQKNFVDRDGRHQHRFGRTCQHCGGYFPAYRALLPETAGVFARSLERPKVFFTDCVSDSTLHLAKALKRDGAVIFFEPFTLGDPGQFLQMLKLADVLKYSDQRSKRFSKYLSQHAARLEIQTLGEEGLRFRLLAGSKSATWTKLPAYLAEIADTSGAGDWTSAGVISVLFGEGRGCLKYLTKKKVQTALDFGQGLAAVNCGYEGARGMMYDLTPAAVKARIATMTHAAAAEYGHDHRPHTSVEEVSSLYSSCGDRGTNSADAERKIRSQEFPCECVRAVPNL